MANAGLQLAHILDPTTHRVWSNSVNTLAM